MSESEKMQAVAAEMAKKIAEELMSAQAKLFQDEISGKNDTSDKNETNKDAASFACVKPSSG